MNYKYLIQFKDILFQAHSKYWQLAISLIRITDISKYIYRYL